MATASMISEILNGRRAKVKRERTILGGLLAHYVSMLVDILTSKEEAFCFHRPAFSCG